MISALNHKEDLSHVISCGQNNIDRTKISEAIITPEQDIVVSPSNSLYHKENL